MIRSWFTSLKNFFSLRLNLHIYFFIYYSLNRESRIGVQIGKHKVTQFPRFNGSFEN